MVDTDLALRYYPIFGAVEPNANAPRRPDIIETTAVRAARYALGGSPDDDPATLATGAGALGEPDYDSGELFPAPGAGPDPSYQVGTFRTPWVRRPFQFDESNAQDLSEAAIRIAYTAAPGAYRTITPKAGDIFVDCGVYCSSQSPVQLAPDFYRGKILLLEDTTCYGISQDCVFAPTSTSKQATAQDLDAAVISQLLRGQALRAPPPWLANAGFFMMALLGAFLVAGLGPLRGALTAPVVLVAYLGVAIGEYWAGWTPDLIVTPAGFVVASVASGTHRYALATLERRRVVDLFGRYVARSVVAQLIKGGRKPALGGETREVTVVFADVRGFTHWSASLPPAQVVATLNQLLAAMVSAAFRHDATVDKYIGDAVMLLFNAPLDQPDHVERALRTAAEMQLSAVGTGLEIGIGVNCGEAVVGNIGTPDRVEYTAIGRTVNLAARLCDNARPGEILVSEEVRRRLRDTYALVAREPLRMKGFDEPVQTYAVAVAEKAPAAT
jgi:class 3 adenylate cyclase